MNIVEMLHRMSTGRALLVGLILGAFYYMVMYDSGVKQKESLVSNRAQLEELQKQVQENQAKLDRAAVYKKTASEIGTTIHKLLSVIPENFSSVDLKKILSNEAKVAGTSLASLTEGIPNISSISKEFEELSVTVDMTGSFLQHMVFFSNLTKINQILIVRKIEFTQTGSARAEDAASIKLNAEVIAYRYRPSGATAGDAAGAAGEVK